MVRLRNPTVLAGRFRVKDRLCYGGMGELWVAEHLGLGNEVVVKIIRSELLDRPGAAARFAREAAAAARVNSPHVVKILEYGVAPDGVPFIVMEKLEGRDLATHLQERGSLSPEAVAQIVRQLAMALTVAHAAQIVHRDIKPANVFLCDTVGELFIKLLDFGIAKTSGTGSGTATASGVWAGTPGYMSPEQILGSKQLDVRADLWSLGVLAFHCLTGRKPFDGETAGGVLLSIHTLSPPRPSRHVPSLPSAVDEWFARACAKEPERRFASAIELADALSSALGLPLTPLTQHAEELQPTPCTPTLSAVVPAMQRGGVRPRPRSATYALRLAAVAAVVIALGGAAYSGNRQRILRNAATGPVTQPDAVPDSAPLTSLEQPPRPSAPVGETAGRMATTRPRSPRSGDPGSAERPIARLGPLRSAPEGTSVLSELAPKTTLSPAAEPAGAAAAPATSAPSPPASTASASTHVDRSGFYAMPDVRR